MIWFPRPRDLITKIGSNPQPEPGHTMTEAAPKKQPSYRAYSVRGEGDNAKWLELGAAWPHSGGEGDDVVLDVCRSAVLTGGSSYARSSPRASNPARDASPEPC
jgi:hypothetical protein